MYSVDVELAPKVLEKWGQEKVKAGRKDATETQETIHHYERQYREFVEGHRKKHASPPVPVPVHRALPPHIPQADAKLFLPHGPDVNCHIWLGHTRHTWNAHYVPFPRVSAPFYKHGSSEEALRYVLRQCWLQHLEAKVLGKEHCPYDGLLP